MHRLLPLLLALAGPAAAAPGTATAIGVGLTGAGAAATLTGVTVLVAVPGVRVLELDDEPHWSTQRGGTALLASGAVLSAAGSGVAAWGANRRRRSLDSPKAWGLVAWTLFGVGLPAAALSPVVGTPVLALSTTAACLQGGVNRRVAIAVAPGVRAEAPGLALVGRF